MRYLWALVFVLLASSAEATVRYASNTGAGTAPCTTSSPAASRCDVVTALTQAVADDTVELLGNTMESPAIYTGANYMIVPPVGRSGTSGHTITVKCTNISGVANPGACLIDGQFINSISGTPRITMNLSGNDWWIFEDFNMRNSGRSVINMFDSNNNIFRRMVVWDAPIDRNGTVVSLNASTDNLFEDFAAFGTGRKLFSPFSGATLRTTFRRCWGRWDGSINVGPKMVATTSYHSDDNTFENCLFTWSGSQMPQNYTVTDNSTVWDSNSSLAGIQPLTETSFTVQNPVGIVNRDATELDGCLNSMSIVGSIGYLLSTDRYPPNQPVFVAGGSSGGGSPQDCSTIQHTLAVIHPSNTQYSSVKGFSLDARPTQNTYSHLTSIRGSADSIPSNWTNLDGATAAAAWGSVTPPTLPSGIPSPWTNTGNGATICTRWGTTTPLWPWVMNERIRIATGMAGNYFNNGGPGCGASQGNCSGTLGTTRSAVDVTADIEALLGAIPAECRSDSQNEPFPDFTGYPTHGQLTDFPGSATPPTNFTALSGTTWTEASGVATANGASVGTIYWNTSFGPNQEAWAELTSLPNTGQTFLLNFLIVDNNNRYRAYLTVVSGPDNDTVTVDKVESGVTTVIGTISLGRDAVATDRLGIRVTDSAIDVGYYSTWSGTPKWKLIGSTTATSAPTSSFIGMGGRTPITVTQFGGGGAAANDTTAPTTPTNLSVTPQFVVGMDLAWTASTDAVGVTEYRIYRGIVSNCSDCVQIGTNTTNTYIDGSATAGVTHFYRVTAVDAALNESAASSIVAGRVPDGTAATGGAGRAR